MSAAEPAAGPVGRGRRRSTAMSVLVMATMTVATLVLVVATARTIGRTTSGFSDATFVITGLGNAHREVLQMQVAAATGAPAIEDIELHRSLFRNQIRLVEPRLPADTDDQRHVGQVYAQLHRVDGTLAALTTSEATPALSSTLRDQLKVLEREMKELYDVEEGRFFGATADALEVTATSQRLLEVLAVLTAALGGWVVFRLQRAAKHDLRDAYASLVAEMGERQVVETALRCSEERFRSLVQHSSDMVAVLEPSGAIAYWSPARRHLVGDVDDDEVYERSYLDFVHPDDRANLSAALASSEHPSRMVAYRMRHADGSWRVVESFLSNLVASPAVGGLVLNTRDVTDRKQFEAELTRQAFHDALTGLANRTLFGDRLTHASKRLGRAGGAVAVVMIDLDGFKSLNDTLGHAAGDAVLTETAARLSALVRSGDTVARLGGDEFAILLEGAGFAEAEPIAQRVVSDLSAPFVVGETELRITASVGVSAARAPTAKADTLLREADMAMYAAKREGKASYRRFEAAMAMQLLDRIELEGDLRSALERSEMEVHYQPTIELTTGAVVGVEALARWNHPLRGWMPPVSFIPIAEESGLIVPLGLWILRQACSEACHFPFVDEPLWLAVNISPRQLREPEFVSAVTSVLAETAFPAERLVLEITETSLMHDMALCIEALHQLRALGIKIAVDDFGTGYSSLGYLQQLPIDVIKIDRSFTRGLRSGTRDAAVAHTIVKLGATMQLAVVAEGIEDAGQARELREMACSFGQGYFFARPMPLAALRDHLADATRATANGYHRLAADDVTG